MLGDVAIGCGVTIVMLLLGSLGVLGFGLIAGNGDDEDDASRHHGYEMDRKYLGY